MTDTRPKGCPMHAAPTPYDPATDGAQMSFDGRMSYGDYLSIDTILTAQHCRTDAAAEALLRQAIDKLHWSARACHRVLKVARTIADLAQAEQISGAHVAEAIQYRRALSSTAD